MGHIIAKIGYIAIAFIGEHASASEKGGSSKLTFYDKAAAESSELGVTVVGKQGISTQRAESHW